MARQSITVLGSLASVDTQNVRYTINTGRPQVDADLTPPNTDRYLASLKLPRVTGGTFEISFDESASGFDIPNQDLSALMETQGEITVAASNGDSVTLDLSASSDLQEPYTWIPSNAAALRTLANTIAGLTDQSLTVTLDDGVETAPATPPTPVRSSRTQTSITIAAFADPDDGGSAITERHIRSREVDTSAWTTVMDVTFPYTITGLTEFTRYEVQVGVENAEGTTWSDSYEELAYDWTTRENVNFPYIISGLDLDTEYDIQQAVENSVGQSDWSATLTDRTLALALYERVSGSYELVTPYERVSGSYELVTGIFERVSGSYES